MSRVTAQRRLTRKPALPAMRPYRETPEVVDAVGRLIATVGKRLATEDPDDLVLLRVLEEKIAEAWRTAVDGQRESGFSDHDIADALGVSRPAVTQRWPRKTQ